MLAISTKTLHVLTGNLLGDGSLRINGPKKNGNPTVNALFEMNKCTKSYDQHLELFNEHYKIFSGKGFRKNSYYSGSLGITVTQFHIFTRSLPCFTALHKL